MFVPNHLTGFVRSVTRIVAEAARLDQATSGRYETSTLMSGKWYLCDNGHPCLATRVAPMPPTMLFKSHAAAQSLTELTLGLIMTA